MTLELAEQMSGGRFVALVFRGVTGLRIGQLASGPLQVDGLVSHDRGASPRDGSRFKIHDRHKEAIEFSCRSYDALDTGAIQRAAAGDEHPQAGARG